MVRWEWEWEQHVYGVVADRVEIRRNPSGLESSSWDRYVGREREKPRTVIPINVCSTIYPSQYQMRNKGH